MLLYYLIITIWRIFIWIIMHSHLKQKLLEEFSGSTLPAPCLFTCFCRNPDKVEATRWQIPASHSPLANCSGWLCGFADWPVFPLKPEQSRNNGLWWADQPPCSKTSPYGAWPRCGLLPLTQIATGFHFNSGPWIRELGGKSSNPWLEKMVCCMI